MKYLLIIICFAFFAFPAVAQNDTDQATIRCYYLFSQKKDKNDKEYSFRDTLTLDIGSQMSRYYDESKTHRDSVFSSILSDYDMSRIKSVSILKEAEPDIFDRSTGDTYRNNNYDGISEQIYKNRKNGTIIMINTAGGSFSSERYKGTDQAGTLDWKITPDTAVFFNYLCQKADLHFRGRDYEVWFTPQIPINDGPWKFFGLPGLILKVKESQGQFDFECIGLEYTDTPYTIKIPEYKYFECNRKEYNKVMNKKSGGQMININNGNIVIANFKADSSLQPIELE